MVCLIIAAPVYGMWYPAPFSHAAGAHRLLLLVVSTSFALGPLLTLFVFRSRKAGLKFDLAAIVILQTCALAYGITALVQSRPIFLVGAVDRFVLVSSSQILDADLAQGTSAQFRSRSWTGPRLAVSVLPEDPNERTELAFAALKGRDVQNLPRYYREYAESGKSLLKRAKPISVLVSRRPESNMAIRDWAERERRDARTVVWVPLQGHDADMVMLLDAETAEPLLALDADPW